MTARLAAVAALLAVPGAALAQLAGSEGSAFQSLTARKPAGLAAKLPAGPDAPRVFPTTSVSALAFSRDGRWVATASYARNPAGEERHRIHLWDRKTGVAAWEFDGHHKPITRMEFAADGAHLLASHDLGSFHRLQPEELVVWKVAPDGEPRSMLARCHLTVDWSLTRDGKTLVVGQPRPAPQGVEDIKRFKGFTAHIVDLPSHRIRRSIVLPDKAAYALALSPDGSLLAAGTDRGALLWDVATGKPLPGITALKERAHLVQFSPDGKTLASVSDDYQPAEADVVDPDFLAMTVRREVELWDVKTLKKTGALKVAARGTFTRLSFLGDKALLTYVHAPVGRWLDVFDLWDLEKREVVHTARAGAVAPLDGGQRLARNRESKLRYDPAIVFENLR